MYDITKESSLKSVQGWINSIKEEADPDVVILLVGNKLDVVQHNMHLRMVKEADVKALAELNGLKHIEVSAVTGENLEQCFDVLL